MRTTWEVWNEIIAKSSAGLTQTEQIVEYVNHFLFNFECGGWLYNLSPEAGDGAEWSRLRTVADCVQIVGAPEVAQTLREVANIVERANIQDEGTWGDFLAQADPEKRIEHLQELISQEIPELWDKLTEYTLAHFECSRG
jgi:hypothetical protein